MKIQKNLKHLFYPAAFAIAFIFCPMAARAFDMTPDATRIISDPAYLPLQGQLYGTTEYTYGIAGSNTNNYLNTLIRSNTTLTNTISQTLAYSLTDDFTLRISDNYEWLSSNNTNTAGISTLTYSNGFTDPTFGLTWRLLDERDHFFNWDLIGAYMPNFINANSATTAQNGTIARGGDTETFGTAFSRETRDFTLYVEGSATYLDNRSVLNPTTAITTTYNATWQYYLLAMTQTRFTDIWSLNAGISHTFNDNGAASYVDGTGTTISSSRVYGDVTSLIGAINFQAVPNRFVISANYHHDFYTNSSVTYPAMAASNITTFNRGDDVIGGEFRYVFN